MNTKNLFLGVTTSRMASRTIKLALSVSMAAVLTFYCLLVTHMPTVHIDNQNDHKLIVILLDGFGRTQLGELKRTIDKNAFARIATNGVFAEYMRPIFPTLTQPNHYALMTGLYAEDHGVVHDVIYDATTRKQYIFDKNPHLWLKNVEPIWLTCIKSNSRVVMRTSRCHSVPVLNITASCQEKLLPQEHLGIFVNNLKESLHRMAHEDVQLAIVHTPLVHQAIHASGTVSTETFETIEQLDHALAQFLDNIDNMASTPNVIVVSDVGLAPTRNMKPVMLGDEIDDENIEELIGSGAFVCIWPRNGAEYKVLESLRNVTGIRVLTKHGQTSAKFHYDSHDTIAPIQVVADEGYYIVHNLETNLSNDRALERHATPMGLHGYDPFRVDDMKVIFFAQGPQFEVGKKISFIHTPEVYAIMRRVLLIDRHSDLTHEGVIKKNPLHPPHH